jgi:hypothetical protein
MAVLARLSLSLALTYEAAVESRLRPWTETGSNSKPREK